MRDAYEGTPGLDAYEGQLKTQDGNHRAGTARGPAVARCSSIGAPHFQPSTTGDGKLPSGGNIIGLKYATGAV